MKWFNSRKKADGLVQAIRARGEKVKVDLGCGFRKKGNIGIDVTAEGTEADLVCNLGFEELPLGDGTWWTGGLPGFRGQHLPELLIYSEGAKRLRYPIIDLMNEIWRWAQAGRDVYEPDAVPSAYRGASRSDAPECVDAGEHALFLREVPCGEDLWGEGVVRVGGEPDGGVLPGCGFAEAESGGEEGGWGGRG